MSVNLPAKPLLRCLCRVSVSLDAPQDSPAVVFVSLEVLHSSQHAPSLLPFASELPCREPGGVVLKKKKKKRAF